MYDKETLKRAAAAGGLLLESHTQKSWAFCHAGVEWNPYDDDGQALRLGIALNIFESPRFFHERSVLMFTRGMSKISATRAAVVITAANLVAELI